MACRREAFLAAAKAPPGLLDLRGLANADNATFLEAACLCLLSRIPEPAERERWSGLVSGQPPAKFRHALLTALLDSGGAKVRGSRVVGDNAVRLEAGLARRPKAAVKKGRVRPGFLPRVLGFFYWKVFMRLPSCLRLAARRLVGRRAK